MASSISNYYKTILATPDSADAIDLENDTIKGMLVTSTYTFDQDSHKYVDQVTNEVSGAGYTAGGFTLQNVTVTQDNTGNRGVVDADDHVYTSATITARAVVLYKDTGTASTSPIIGYFDFNSNVASTNGDFTISWNATGIFTIG